MTFCIASKKSFSVATWGEAKRWRSVHLLHISKVTIWFDHSLSKQRFCIPLILNINKCGAGPITHGLYTFFFFFFFYLPFSHRTRRTWCGSSLPHRVYTKYKYLKLSPGNILTVDILDSNIFWLRAFMNKWNFKNHWSSKALRKKPFKL